MSEMIEQTVMAEQQEKIALGKELQAAIDRQSACEVSLKEAQDNTVKARKAALRGGWDEKTLRKLGLLTTKPQPRSRKPQKPSADSDQESHNS